MTKHKQEWQHYVSIWGFEYIFDCSHTNFKGERCGGTHSILFHKAS